MTGAVISTASTVVVSPRQISCKIEGETALLQLEDGVYYGLDPVGTRIWDLIQERRTVADVRDRVCAEFEVDSATCERDLLDLLNALAQARLIEVT